MSDEENEKAIVEQAKQLKHVPEIRNQVHNTTEQSQENIEEMIDIIYKN